MAAGAGRVLPGLVGVWDIAVRARVGTGGCGDCPWATLSLSMDVDIQDEVLVTHLNDAEWARVWPR